MKNLNEQFFTKMVLTSALMLIATVITMAQQLAFPGAEGFGRFTTGGRGGTVYHVTNLNDSGAGSFRDAVSQPNRYVVFDVGGVITLNSVVVVEDNITVAGMTAPGGGITIYKHRVAFNGNSGNDVIRYMRFRLGRHSGGKDDAMSISDDKDNYMFDHVSISWGRDGTFDINTDSENITLQDCIIGQGLQRDNHSTGSLIQGANLSISIIRSLYIDNKTRNPKIRGTHEFINSVLYNWDTDGYIMGDTEGNSACNLIGSYFIYGPDSNGGSHIVRTTPTFKIYEEDNWVDSNKDGQLNGSLITDYKTATLVSTPYNYPGVINQMSAADAVDYVIKNAGSSLTRDAVDNLLIEELASFGTKGAIIYGEEDNNIPNHVGVVENGTPPTDTDGDAMPDFFEDLIGYDKNKSDYNEDADGDGYPNIEEYFNCLTCNCDVKMPNCSVLSPGAYTITSNSDLCLSNEGTGTLTQEECTGASNQGWIFNEVGDDVYTIRSYKDDAYLTFVSAQEGTEVKLAASSSLAKEFEVAIGDGLEYTLKSVDGGLYLAIDDASTDEGAGFILTASPASGSEIVKISGFQPIIDCAGVADGEASIDDCGVCSGGDTGVEACSGGIGGEEFCASESVGVFEDSNGGYLGEGYFNFDNSAGTTASYKVYSKSAQSVDVTIRFANGGGSSRPLSITVNGTEQVSELAFPNTDGVWTTWQETNATLTFEEGENDILLTSTGNEGGPNIDLMSFNADGLYPILGCNESYVLDCFGVPDGEAFLDECEACVGGKTGEEACEPQTEPELSTIDAINVNLYPNPFHNQLTIESIPDYSYTIYNMAGQLIEREEFVQANKHSVGVDLVKGVYLMKIQTVDGESFTKRIVKR